jgi:osmotically-inducible protein OsmY
MKLKLGVIMTLALMPLSFVSAEGVRKYEGAKTAQDQSTTPSDVELTRKIRADLVKSDMSTAAKNVTVISNRGAVILKGEVPSQAERDAIDSLARSMAQNVNNQITVKK